MVFLDLLGHPNQFSNDIWEECIPKFHGQYKFAMFHVELHIESLPRLNVALRILSNSRSNQDIGPSLLHNPYII